MKRRTFLTFLLFVILSSVLLFGFYNKERITRTTWIREPTTTVNSKKSLSIKELTNCVYKPLVKDMRQRGIYWVIYNYVIASKNFDCGDSITYATHTDYSYLDNLNPLLEKWKGPISVALHAPGSDFIETIYTIQYLKECTSELINEYVTFHVYFPNDHVPKEMLSYEELSQEPYNCTLGPPYHIIDQKDMYKTKNKILYPLNVGRNIAREYVQTHFLLTSDIELYPSRDVIPNFLAMIKRRGLMHLAGNMKVYPLPLFEVYEDMPVPPYKTDLQEMLRNKSAIPFHKFVCPSCHYIPKFEEWIQAKETKDLDTFEVGKRLGKFANWEPIFIGTNADPLYDERLPWDGKKDKMPQGYAMCVLDYEFHILNNAFLVHRPGIKIFKHDKWRDSHSAETNVYIKNKILPEYKILYGYRKGCIM